MKQLAMKWQGIELPQISKQLKLQDNLQIRSFQQGDLADLTLALRGFNCTDSSDQGENFTEAQVKEIILNHQGVYPAGIFLAYEGDRVLGTTTGCYEAQPGYGALHMVSVVEAARGKRLGTHLCLAAMAYLISGGCHVINLTTDDFRLPAIKTYLDLGFLPVLWDKDMLERWSVILSQMKISMIQAYPEKQAEQASTVISPLSV